MLLRRYIVAHINGAIEQDWLKHYLLAAGARRLNPGGQDKDLYAVGGTFRRSVSGLSDAQPSSVGGVGAEAHPAGGKDL